MDNVFYEVMRGTPEHDWCKAYREQRVAKGDEYQQYAKSIGAARWVVGYHGGLNGFVFENDECELPGFKKGRRTNEGFVCFVPRSRGTEGKAVSAALDALGRFPDADEFCRKFNIPEVLEYLNSKGYSGKMRCGFFETAQIGWMDDGSFWVVLPDITKLIDDKKAEGSTVTPGEFVVPQGLKRSTKSRYELALAEDKVRQEEQP